MKLSKCIIALLMVSSLSACSTNDKEPVADSADTNACGDEVASCGLSDPADMNAYETFTNANQVFQKSDLPAVLKLIEEKQSAIVYFGFPTCPWCLEAVPVLDEVAKEQNKTLFYVETRDAERNAKISDEDKAAFIEHAAAYLDRDDEGKPQLFNPCVVVIKDGVVQGAHTGTVAAHDAKERKMSDEEKAELKQMYSDLLNI